MTSDTTPLTSFIIVQNETLDVFFVRRKRPTVNWWRIIKEVRIVNTPAMREMSGIIVRNKARMNGISSQKKKATGQKSMAQALRFAL